MDLIPLLFDLPNALHALRCTIFYRTMSYTFSTLYGVLHSMTLHLQNTLKPIPCPFLSSPLVTTFRPIPHNPFAALKVAGADERDAMVSLMSSLRLSASKEKVTHTTI